MLALHKTWTTTTRARGFLFANTRGQGVRELVLTQQRWFERPRCCAEGDGGGARRLSQACGFVPPLLPEAPARDPRWAPRRFVLQDCARLLHEGYKSK